MAMIFYPRRFVNSKSLLRTKFPEFGNSDEAKNGSFVFGRFWNDGRIVSVAKDSIVLRSKISSFRRVWYTITSLRQNQHT